MASLRLGYLVTGLDQDQDMIQTFCHLASLPTTNRAMNVKIFYLCGSLAQQTLCPNSEKSYS